MCTNGNYKLRLRYESTIALINSFFTPLNHKTRDFFTLIDVFVTIFNVVFGSNGSEDHIFHSHIS